MKIGGAAFAAILVVCAGLGGPAAASDQKISAHAMDWNNPAQVSALYDKLSRAAEKMCASSGAERRAVSRCMEQTIAAAVQESGRPELLAFHLARAAPRQLPSTS